MRLIRLRLIWRQSARQRPVRQRPSVLSCALLGLSAVATVAIPEAEAREMAAIETSISFGAPEPDASRPSLSLWLYPYPSLPKANSKPRDDRLGHMPWNWDHAVRRPPLPPVSTAAALAQAAEEPRPNAPIPQGDGPEAQLFGDPELGVIRVRSPLEDPGLDRLTGQEPPTSSDNIGFLSARFSWVNSDNVLLLVNDVGGLTGDTFYRPAATLAVYPSLGPETALAASVDIGFQRYGQQSAIDYNDWRARVALRQGLSPRAYAQIGVTYQELWRVGGSGFRFFDNRAVAFSLGRRDPLSPRLTLDSFYQVQWNEAHARSQTASGVVTTDFSRLSQSAGAYLGYTLSPQWHTGLNYQINLIDYSAQDRHDTVQQWLGQLVYSITPQVRFSLYGGWSFGRSSDPSLRLNDALFGITLDATVPLF